MKTLPHRQRLLPYWTHFKVSVGLNLLLAFHLRYRMNRENYCPWFGRSVVHSLTPIFANNTPQYKWSVKEQTSERPKRKAKERLTFFQTVCLNWSISFVDWNMNSPLVLLLFPWYLERKEYCFILKSTSFCFWKVKLILTWLKPALFTWMNG